MPRQRDYLKDLVAARIDELIPTGDNVGGQTAIEASYPKIEEELDLAVLHILRTAPEHLLYAVSESDKKHFHKEEDEDVVADVDTRIVIGSDLVTTIVLPDNFFRFVHVKLTGWKRRVTQLLSVNDAKYRAQFNQFSSGNHIRPVAVLEQFNDYTDGTGATSDELTKRTITQTYTVNIALSTIYNGQDPNEQGALATGNIVVLKGQTDYTQNGTYKVNESGSPTKLTHNTTPYLPKQALQCFKAKASDDTLEELVYIPRLKAEQMPDEFADIIVDETAYRVLRTMGAERAQEAVAAKESATMLLNSMKIGLQGEL